MGYRASVIAGLAAMVGCAPTSFSVVSSDGSSSRHVEYGSEPREEQSGEAYAGYREAGNYFLCSVEGICRAPSRPGDGADYHPILLVGNGEDPLERMAKTKAILDFGAQCYALRGTCEPVDDPWRYVVCAMVKRD